MPLNVRRCLVLGLIWLASCDARSPQGRTFELSFVAESDPGVPLAEVRVFVDGELVGESGADGEVEVFFRRQAGAAVKVEHDCPVGHRDPQKSMRLRLRPFEAIGDARPDAIEFRLRCPPIERIAAFVVRTDHAAPLSVLLNGKEVAGTNQLGVAHFMARGEPGTEYTVSLDTSSEPLLEPQHPSRLFVLEDQHEVFVFAQAFEQAESPRRKWRRTRRIIRIQ